MEKLKEFENQILNDWNRNTRRDPYAFLVDIVGDLTRDKVICCIILTSLVTNDLISTEFYEAFANGFDDVSGFAFFYFFRYLVRDVGILSKMEKAVAS